MHAYCILHTPCLVGSPSIAFVLGESQTLRNEILAEADPVAWQEEAFLRNFKLYATGAASKTLALPHRPLESWAWYNGYGSPMSSLYPQIRDGNTVDWAAISALTQAPNRYLRRVAPRDCSHGLGRPPWSACCKIWVDDVRDSSVFESLSVKLHVGVWW